MPPLRFRDQVLEARTRLRDGTHRAATLDATWRRFAPMARRAGITRIADLTGLDTLGIPVFTAIRPMSRSLSTQQGKGLTPLAAKVSALMESLETWTAEHAAENPALPITHATARARPDRVDLRQLPRLGKRIPLDERWPWVPGYALASAREVAVPLAAVSLDTTRVVAAPPLFDMSSNGLASGNVLVEAIVHGLCEVIERDAEAAWRRAGGDRRLVLDTLPVGPLRGLVDRIAATGARVFVWDLESDTGLCTIGCGILENPHEPAWRPLGFYQGFGAHARPEVAIARALTEAAQTRLTYIAGGRDDFFPFDYARATDPELMRDLWERLAGPCDDPIAFDDLPALAAPTLGTQLEALVARVGEVIVVDLTHPTLRVPVVKVLVPGRATDLEAMG